MERTLLITVDLKTDRTWTARERMDELSELARSAGAFVVESMVVPRHEPSPAFFIGKGKIEEIAQMCGAKKINLVIFNNDLSGTQQKNIEEAVGAKVIDRTQLILDIFAKRAHSNEGKLQVELAQLLYLMPRLSGKGIHLSRLGGGIGTRGPGEQKLEVDRRTIRARISKLERELVGLSERRNMVRKHRSRFSLLTVALIGYTNVGKSSLLNALTKSNVIAEDRLFSTLDPTVRCFIMPNKQKVLFIDTVGFIDKLPHHLVEAFKATLEEATEADLLLHVVDINHPKSEEQAAAAYKVLEDIGAGEKPVLNVLNKIDLLKDRSRLSRAKEYFNTDIALSALTREGLDSLVNGIMSYMKKLMVTIRVEIPQSDTKRQSIIYENGLVLRREYKEDRVIIEAEVPLKIKDIVA